MPLTWFLSLALCVSLVVWAQSAIAAPRTMLLRWDADPAAEGYVVSSCQTDWRQRRCQMSDELAGQLPPTVTTYLASLPTAAALTKCYRVATRKGPLRLETLYWLCFPPETKGP